MKRRIFLLPLLLIVSLVIISRPVLGNGTVEPQWYEAPLGIVFLVFVIGPIIESLIVLLFLKKGENFSTYLSLFLFFLLINFFTIGPTQFFVIMLADIFRTNLFVIAEIFPITAEFLALLAFFIYYRKNRLLKNEYSVKYQFIMSLVSNLITIILGVTLFFAIP